MNFISKDARVKADHKRMQTDAVTHTAPDHMHNLRVPNMEGFSFQIERDNKIISVLAVRRHRKFSIGMGSPVFHNNRTYCFQT